MKKTISVILCILMLFACVHVAGAVHQIDPEYPTIIVAGYSASSLYLKTEDGREKVWGVNVNNILQKVLHNIVQVGIGLGGLTVGKTDYLADTVGRGAVELYGMLACNPDGSSVNDLEIFSAEASETQFSYLYDSGNGDQTHEAEIMADIASLYGEDGYDHIFCFMHDFRKSIIYAAESLDKYIDNVLEFTGADQVNIFAVSHGGEITSVYFSEYGYKNKVHNAVLTVPAIGGAALAYDTMNECIDFDEDTLLNFIQNGMMLEEDYDWLVTAEPLGFLDPLCNRIAGKWVKQIMGYWGSIWDFIPAEYYDEMKEKYLDPVESAELIANSDYYHYELLPHMAEKLGECVENGTNIYLVAGTDITSVTGLKVQSDGIIPVNAATGATCAPIGSRFAAGFSGKKTTCDDPTHNHVSPAMNIDGSTGYLPDYTWFVSGMFHGMGWKDPYVVNLCETLISSDEQLDVFSMPEFPQFHYSTNTCYTVYGEFDQSSPGYLSGDDSIYRLTNLSKDHILRVISINCEGAGLKFDTGAGLYLKPGATVSVRVSGDVPEESFVTADVTVNYCLLGSVTPYNCRTLTYTVLNGDVVGDGNGLLAAKHDTPFDLHFNSETKAILKKLGLLELFRLFYNIMAGFVKTFGK